MVLARSAFEMLYLFYFEQTWNTYLSEVEFFMVSFHQHCNNLFIDISVCLGYPVFFFFCALTQMPLMKEALLMPYSTWHV